MTDHISLHPRAISLIQSKNDTHVAVQARTATSKTECRPPERGLARLDLTPPSFEVPLVRPREVVVRWVDAEALAASAA